jgi:hypothetical protein
MASSPRQADIEVDAIKSNIVTRAFRIAALGEGHERTQRVVVDTSPSQNLDVVLDACTLHDYDVPTKIQLQFCEC